MSSPIHHAKDLDVALTYAPPWVRDRSRPPADPPSAPAEPPPRLQGLRSAAGSFSGDRAMAVLQRQLALNPTQVPEPPVEDARSAWPIGLRLGALTGVAALIAWGLVALPGSKKAGNDVAPVDVAPAPTPVKRVKLVRVQTGSVTAAAISDGVAQDTAPPPADAAGASAAQTASVASPVDNPVGAAPPLPPPSTPAPNKHGAWR
jgi:hypothetical protein